ncbi:MAG: tRNA preQ1(34) S-adenosylmethionine ribosyltransferase-isomerase QueA [Actinobacteria bacterium]|nr:tRNA preQ1(34) S-adenosylmethionine ribosyltransferase-isomerase QueA [Actinomycetota bacterium]
MIKCSRKIIKITLNYFNHLESQFEIDSYNYSLPEKLIAQKPLEKRDHSKMLVLQKSSGNIVHDFFYNIEKYLLRSDMLVVNESKVIKCRLEGIKEPTGAKIECFVLKKMPGYDKNACCVLLKPAKRLKNGDKVFFGKYFLEVADKQDFGKAIAIFCCDPDIVMQKHGKIPLPPYIKNTNIMDERYQTVYAERQGSAAAPTAGLHFTQNIINRLSLQGIKFAKLSLDIGLDTFRPIASKDIRNHDIHKENYFVLKSEALKIEKARKMGERIIAVGTTAARVLETVTDGDGRISYGEGSTGLYIYPGYAFKAVDGLLTNFHLPGSSLLVMVSAFAGRKNILNAYKEAIKKNYRFFSFGDCMLII